MTMAISKFVTITPKMAEDLLNAHQDVVDKSGFPALNRIINDNTVAQYANDMSKGNWVANGETIKVAENGRIPDGQHRLWACINSGANFDTLLVSGFKESEIDRVFVTTDIGRVKI